MKRIQSLSNYLLVKWNLRYPAFLFVAILFFIFNNSCIEQFTPQLDDYESDDLIVVEGQITDEEGPFRVKLTKTFELDNMQEYSPPVYGADVQIFDDKGNQFQLYQKVEGWYETEDKKLKGVAGNTYTLNITLEDGMQYESSPVLMHDVPEIDSVYFEVNPRARFDEEFVLTEEWLDIFVDSKDPTGKTKYWKWDFEETWEVKIPTDSLLIQHGWDNERAYYTTEKVNIDPEEEVCWVTMPSKSIHIKSTSKNSDKNVKRVTINSIGANGDRLHIKYSIIVRQTALNEEIYRFWERLKDANEQSGSMYDKVPSQIFGNIHCCNRKSKTLGYFSASAVKERRIFIYPYEHSIKTESAYFTCFYLTEPEPRTINIYYFGMIETGYPLVDYSSEIYPNIVWTFDKFCNDCREYGTSVKPDFWE